MTPKTRKSVIWAGVGGLLGIGVLLHYFLEPDIKYKSLNDYRNFLQTRTNEQLFDLFNSAKTPQALKPFIRAEFHDRGQLSNRGATLMPTQFRID